MIWQELHFPSDLSIDPVLSFTRVLAMRPRHGFLTQPNLVVCELVSTDGALRWTIGLVDEEAETLVPQLRAAVPGLRVETLDGRLLPDVPRAIELRLSSGRRSLRTDTSDAVSSALLTAANDVGHGEAVVLSWLIGPWLPRAVVKRQGITKPAAGFDRLVLNHALDSDDVTSLKKKQSEPVLGVAGFVGVQAAGAARQRQLVQRVLGALQLTRQPGVGLDRRLVGGRRAARRLRRLHRPLIGWPCPLNAAELATVLGWPIGNPHLLDVSYRGGRQLPPAAGTFVPRRAFETAPDRHRVVGEATFPGREGLLELPATAALQHLHVIGPTGSGKSVLLSRLIESDLVAGRAVVVIEPKADLIASVLERMPEDRVDDVVLLDPTDRERAVGLDLLGNGSDPELAVDQLLHVLRELYRDSWGPRTSQILHAGLLTLARAGDQTLCELPLLLTNEAFRRRVLQRANDPLSTGAVWSWFDSLSEAERSAVIGPSLNKLGAFLHRRAIRGIVGQADSPFRLLDVFTKRRVLLVNLAKGVIGPEAARLLGALIFSQLWQTALGRSGIDPAKRHPVMVYVDEFQDYVRGTATDFGELLAQARGIGVGLSLAHQGLHQLDPDTKAGVLTNARSRIAFQASGPEAKTLASVLGGGLTDNDIQSLGSYEAYASLVANGRPMPPASMRSLPPAKSLGRADAVRARSREQWSSPLVDVDAAILTRRTSPQGIDQQLGGRRRRSS